MLGNAFVMEKILNYKICNLFEKKFGDFNLLIISNKRVFRINTSLIKAHNHK